VLIATSIRGRKDLTKLTFVPVVVGWFAKSLGIGQTRSGISLLIVHISIVARMSDSLAGH
jgi:hypothetical protein